MLRLLQKRRYEDITVSQLCEHMNIPRKTFYRYFSDKEGALYALIDHTLIDFFQTPSLYVPKGSAVGDELGQFFAFWYENKDFLDALGRSGLSGILVERANTLALREGYMPRQFKTVPAQIQAFAMAFTVCGLMSVVLQWYHGGFLLTPEEMTDFAASLLTNPLINRT